MHHDARGFTLLEVVIALVLIAVGVIATAPLFVFASKENAVGGDMGTIGAAAVRQMEMLRATPYPLLDDGGSLTGDVSGYSDTTSPEVHLRWTIVVNPNPPAPTKLITVRATAVGNTIGKPKSVTMATVRGG